MVGGQDGARGLTANSANKDFVYLTSTLREVARSRDFELRSSTRRLAPDEGKPAQRPAFTTKWISEKLMRPGALEGPNGEARAILLGMVNTGHLPSEGAALTADFIRLDANVPHIRIAAEGRQLKSHNAERVIPLCCVSLEAFRAFKAGFPRYADNPALSDTVNKFLRENGLH